MTPESKYSVESLGRWVRQVMIEESMNLDAAVKAVHTEIVRQGLVEQWWEALGPWMIREAERRVLSQGPGPRPLSPDAQQPAPSWRAKFKDNPARVWDMEFPVGSSGERKRLGDFAQIDVYAIRNMYLQRAQTMQERGEMWGKIAEKMSKDETLQQTYERGVLTQRDMGFLQERCRVDDAA